jgi:outer membrane protein assembly factor BamD (BamD/ComL family)
MPEKNLIYDKPLEIKLQQLQTIKDDRFKREVNIQQFYNQRLADIEAALSKREVNIQQVYNQRLADIEAALSKREANIK